jgi:uncharacterized repeat protein (TIGR01451 family)
MKNQTRYLLIAAILFVSSIVLLPDGSARRNANNAARANQAGSKRAAVQSASPLRLSGQHALLASLLQEGETDLGVTKVADADTVAAGSNITYTITVTNNGPDTAVNAMLEDVIPAGTTFVSVAEPDGWTCTTPVSTSVNCSNPSLEVTTGEGEVFTLVVQVDPSVMPGTFITNTATVSTDTFDVNEENNSSSTATLVAGGVSADIGVTKVVSAETVLAGSDVTYTITVTNSGADAADNVTLEDTLPGDMEFVSLSAPDGWTCTTPSPSSGGTISCTISSLAVTTGEVFTLVGHIPSSASPNTEYTNTATVNTTTPDPDPDNNSSTVTTTVADCTLNPVVNRMTDSGDGSLRQAIGIACAGSNLTFEAGLAGPITLTSGELLIDKNLTIQGPGARSVTVVRDTSAPEFRIFHIGNSNYDVTIDGLTISNGKVNSGFGLGGGLFNESTGNVQITNSTISGNTAFSGGGIFNLGPMVIRDSTISGNTAQGGEGGGIDSEGGPFHLINSTLSGNSADTDGGGLLNCDSSTAFLTNVTITNNRADADNNNTGEGGGIGQVSSNPITLNNTIVAGNFNDASPSETPDDFFVFSGSTLDSNSSHNLIGVDTGFTGITDGSNGNQIGTAGAPLNPQLSPLANNGGATDTHRLLPNSTAINAGDNELAVDQNNAALTTDQRGAGFPRIVNTTVDIGSVEVSYAISATAGTPQSAPINGTFASLLEATVTESGLPASGVSVTFVAPSSGASGTFLTANPVVTDVNGKATVQFKANTITGSYQVTANTTPALPSAAIFNLTNTVGAPSSITSFAGSGQSTPINTAFSTQLQARVTDSSGNPLSNVTVTFNAPSSGASGTFAGGSTTADANTNADGVATAPVFTANGTAGSYNVTASTPGVSPSTTFSLTNTKGQAQIILSNLNQTYDGTPKSATATTNPPGLNGVTITYDGSTTAPTNAGSYAVVASLNNNDYEAPDATGTLVINKASTSTSLTSSANPSQFGQSVTFTATVTSAAGTPTGTVNFKEGATTLGSGTLNASGVATFTTSTLTLGNHSITAEYVASTNFNASTSAPVTQVVNKANSSTSLTSSVNPSQFGQSVTFTATVTSATTGTPTGTVQFKDNGTNLGAPAALNASGVATFTTSALTSGTHTITAEYSGDANFNSNTGTLAGGQAVNKANSSVAVTSSVNPSQFGQSVTFTATVTSTAGTPTGTVQFKDNGTNLGSPVALNASGVATFTTSALTSGTHTITAEYSGDANFNPSTDTLAGGQVVGTAVSISISDVTIMEGNTGTTNAVFNVTLSAATNVTVTVDYVTADGTATMGSDYQPASGTLTFNPNETSKSITVLVNGDTLDEPGETFNVNLSNPTNATVADAQGLGTISNDDSPGIAFSLASYSVNENASSAVITVNRVGDTSQAASVDYATSDGFGLAACTVVNGQASERCDYLTATGRLVIPAGQASATFRIFIIDDAHVEGAETLNLTLSGASGASLGTPNTATLTITDNDTQPSAPNPIDGNEFFIRQQYLDFLYREPDPTGFQNWLQTLQGCPDGGFGLNHPTCDRVHVAKSFYGSPEFADKGFFIYRFYDAALSRRPTFQEFNRDLQKIGGQQTPAQSEAAKLQFIAEFMSRQEFITRYGASIPSSQAAQFVSALEQFSGVQIPEPARSQMISQMQNGQKTAGETLRAFIERQEVFDRFFNRGYASMLYFAHLRRDPDETGFNNYVQLLNTTGNYRQATFDFIFSPEYRSRFGAQ